MNMLIKLAVALAFALTGAAAHAQTCNSDLKFALKWADTWQSQAPNGQVASLRELRGALKSIESDLKRSDGTDILLQQFHGAVQELRLLRHKNRPNSDPRALDEALYERIIYDLNHTSLATNAMADCIDAALPVAPTKDDDIALGAALLLDYYLDPSTNEWITDTQSILADVSRRNMASLMKLMTAMRSNLGSFMGRSHENHQHCRTTMDEMFTNPGFRFRLRNRRDPENQMRILAFDQETITRSIGELRDECPQ